MGMLVLLLVGLVGCTTHHSDQYYADKFVVERAKYKGERLAAGEDTKAEFREFKKVAMFIEDHNVNDGGEWKADFNVFSVMTESEKAAHLGLNVSMLEHPGAALAERSLGLQVRAATVDYSAKLPGVKNQGSCGSCWTFGAVAALEYQVNKKRNNPTSLSEQQYLDCVYEGSRDGCSGGWPSTCYTWSSERDSHIAKSSDYPYVASDGTCKYTSKPNGIKGFTITGTEYLEQGDQAMLAAVADSEIGVISVAIMVDNSFYQYSSGVFSSASCNSQVNHAVDVVGYGTLDTVPYFRVRNSWGAWGDAGYINMKRGSGTTNVNMCLISDHGHYPVVTGSGSDEGEEEEEEEEEEEGSEECIKADIGLFPDEQKLSQRTLQSVGACQSWCDEETECVAVAISPSYWAHRECFLVSAGSELGARRGWSGGVKSCWNKDPADSCTWETKAGYKLRKPIGGFKYTMSEAQDMCQTGSAKCAGVTCNKKSQCRLSSVKRGTQKTGFTSYICKK